MVLESEVLQEVIVLKPTLLLGNWLLTIGFLLCWQWHCLVCHQKRHWKQYSATRITHHECLAQVLYLFTTSELRKHDHFRLFAKNKNKCFGQTLSCSKTFARIYLHGIISLCFFFFFYIWVLFLWFHCVTVLLLYYYHLRGCWSVVCLTQHQPCKKVNNSCVH